MLTHPARGSLGFEEAPWVSVYGLHLGGEARIGPALKALPLSPLASLHLL